ncbi:UDP-N-acetylglucosamine--dolichyl-phosphate N-acetylglucosaminephosphotransferase [Anopheles ziemanni]|uniref:UDP-N-acetylglucosamine--dolichyl-phosphate N-acetylglucosaminephosphotransferase n=1 Tax=Anopheles coustani TaxID=139045 RepID=UPI0026590CDD|nr:UDP-N-acetylglucosamine--dolichyl-phosphate N-acetylglucosaminephosphotransferase [Anopheles coustani]XP_058168162.1 UDP-N-acetylglucosamine--dolichyl-phosphate N-acetylglucosaminephosphotransferase [Anopheles ziemanni]
MPLVHCFEFTILGQQVSLPVPLLLNVAISAGAFLAGRSLIPKMKPMFINANLYGIDMNKKSKPKIPEAFGVVTGCIFLVSLFLFIPVPFLRNFSTTVKGDFPHDKFVEFIAAMLSICCMILLGFADDVLNLRWRDKLYLPTIASLPLLMVYYTNFNSTTVILPKLVRPLLGQSLDIGVLYYVFMGMLAVFCTNAINILAGINGLEVCQSLIIAGSIVVFNVIEILSGHHNDAHEFSLYIMLPYIGATLALWRYNRYPSEVFVGDTFNYLSGMTFAVVGILGHFSKTVLLFFIPQVLNFLYSVPQLFRFIPCPRHRMPKHDPTTDLLHISRTQFRVDELNALGRLCYQIFHHLRLIRCEVDRDGKTVTCNNFTIINFCILLTGPIREDRLNRLLVIFQLGCAMFAFTIRYPLAHFFYDAN